MNPKFKHQEKVLYKGEVEEITVIKKDFSTNKISYRLKSGALVSEEELMGLDAPEIVQEPKPEVKPIMEPKPEPVISQVDKEKEKKAAYDLLSKLSKPQLINFIEEQKQKGRLLELDPADYGTRKELVTAVCEELEAELPTK